MARVAPFFPNTATGDAVTKTFQLAFPILSQEHVRVFVAGVLKVLGTDYAIVEATSRTPSVRFFAAPANAAAITFYRNTPIGSFTVNPEISHLEARQAAFRTQERQDQRLVFPFALPIATLITTPTAQSFIAPCDGYLERLAATVESVITTGGTLQVSIDGVAVTGLVATIANSAGAGVQSTVNPTTPQSTTTKVKKGQVVAVTPASFATAGAMSGVVELQPADLT
jgi:hypothetical protein